jgi:anaerobic magnesium-protoporphyrin IX monomethyl ester cyclase
MFYHDWNMPSITLKDGSIQRNRTNITTTFLNNFAFRSLVGGDAYSRRFRWRHLGVFVERLLCSTVDDVRRFVYAKRSDLSLDERQRLIVETVISDDFVDRLARRRAWRSPLSLRNGLWSGSPTRDGALPWGDA